MAYVLGSERQLPKKRPHSDVLERIADLSGVDRSRLEDSTMQGCSGVVLYVQSRWRLRTAIWECSQCKSRGIEDRDRGFAIAFACIRCGTLLGISGSDDTESKQQVELEPSMIELQRELLASFHSTAESPAAAERLDRLSIGANTLGQALSRRGRAADLTQWPAVEGSWRCEVHPEKWTVVTRPSRSRSVTVRSPWG